MCFESNSSAYRLKVILLVKGKAVAERMGNVVLSLEDVSVSTKASGSPPWVLQRFLD